MDETLFEGLVDHVLAESRTADRDLARAALLQYDLDPTRAADAIRRSPAPSPARTPLPTYAGVTPASSPPVAARDEDEEAVLVGSVVGRFMFAPWSAAAEQGPSSALMFTDPDFAAADMALAPCQEEQFAAWRRPSELDGHAGSHLCVVVGDRLSPGRVRQGRVGSCGLLAALECVARHEDAFCPGALTSGIFPREGGRAVISPVGRYVVRLYWNGSARAVVIDDRFPVDCNGQWLCCSSFNKSEIWPMLLEKAYMKLRGGYTDGSLFNEVTVLLGWIPQITRNLYEDGDALFQRLLEGFRTGICMAVFVTGSEADSSLGLYKEHAYALLDIREAHGGSLRLVKLKNPWGTGQWKGQFSKEDRDSWAPDLQSELNFDRHAQQMFDNGEFWMRWEDVVVHFEMISSGWMCSIAGFEDLNKDQMITVPDRCYWNSPQYLISIDRAAATTMWIQLDVFLTGDSDEKSDYWKIDAYLDSDRVPREREDALFVGKWYNMPSQSIRLDVPDGKKREIVICVLHSRFDRAAYFSIKVLCSSTFALTTLRPENKGHCTAISGRWADLLQGGCPNNPSFIFNPVYRLKFYGESGKVTNLSASIESSARIPIGMALLPARKSKHLLECMTSRHIKTTDPYRITLALLEQPVKTGYEYLIVCTTFEPDIKADFELKVTSTRASVSLRPVQMPWDGYLSFPEIQGVLEPVHGGMFECRFALTSEDARAELMAFVVPKSKPAFPDALSAFLAGTEMKTLAEFESVGKLLTVHYKKMDSRAIAVVRSVEQIHFGLRLFSTCNIEPHSTTMQWVKNLVGKKRLSMPPEAFDNPPGRPAPVPHISPTPNSPSAHAHPASPMSSHLLPPQPTRPAPAAPHTPAEAAARHRSSASTSSSSSSSALPDAPCAAPPSPAPAPPGSVTPDTSPAALASAWASYKALKGDPDKPARLHQILKAFNSLCDAGRLDAHEGGGGGLTSTQVRELCVAAAACVRAVPIVDLTPTPEPSSLPYEAALSLAHVFDPRYPASAASAAAWSADTAANVSQTGLPSALVRALCAAPQRVEESDTSPAAVAAPSVLTRAWSAVLVSLCSHRAAVSELIASDALHSLFVLAASKAGSGKRAGARDTALEAALVIVSRGHIEASATPYLHRKATIKRHVESVKASLDSLSPEDVATHIKILCCSVRDAERYSPGALLTDFTSGGGLALIRDALVWLEAQRATKDTMAQISGVLDSLRKLMDAGPEPGPFASEAHLPYNNQLVIDRWKVNKTDATCVVRNKEAFIVLQWFFLRSRWDSARLRVLEEISRVYASAPVNFVILQEARTLTHLVTNMDMLSKSLKEEVARLLVFVATAAGIVPFQDLVAFNDVIDTIPKPSTETLAVVLSTVERLALHDDKYKHVFRDSGFLGVLLCALGDYATDMQQAARTSAVSPDQLSTVNMIVRCLRALADNVPQNVEILFHHKRAFEDLLFLVRFPESRPTSLECLLKAGGQRSVDVFKSLMKAVQARTGSVATATSDDELFSLQTEIFKAICVQAGSSDDIKDLLCDAGGFITALSVVAELGDAFTPDMDPAKQRVRFGLLESVMSVFVAGTYKNERSRRFMTENVGHMTIAAGIRKTGLLTIPSLALPTLNAVLDLAVDAPVQARSSLKYHDIQSPAAVSAVMSLLPAAPRETQISILGRIYNLMTASTANEQAISSLDISEFILRNFGDEIKQAGQETTELQTQLLQIIEHSMSLRATPKEMLAFLRLFQSDSTPDCLFRCLARIASRGCDISLVPSLEFDLERGSGVAAALLPLGSGGQQWPPANGFTFMCWIYVVSFGTKERHQVDLISFQVHDIRSRSSLTVQGNGVIAWQSGVKAPVLFYGCGVIEEKKWYHVAITQSRAVLRVGGGADAVIYVDGAPLWSGKLPYLADSADPVTATFGTPSIMRRIGSDQKWKLGSSWFLNKALAPPSIAAAFHLGPFYSGNFQGSLAQYAVHDAVSPESLVHAKQTCPSWDGVSSPSPVEVGQGDAIIDVAEMHIVFAISASHETRVSDAGVPQLINSADHSYRSWASMQGGCTLLSPRPLKVVLRSCGGVGTAISLIERAQTPVALVCAVTALCAIIRQDPDNAAEMDAIKGWPLTAALLRARSNLMSEAGHTVAEHLMAVSGARPRPGIVANVSVLRHIALDTELWNASGNPQLQCSILEDLAAMVRRGENPHAMYNATRMRSLHLVTTLSAALRDERLPDEVASAAVDLVREYIATTADVDDVRSLVTSSVGLLPNYSFTPKSGGLHVAPAGTPVTRSMRLCNHVLTMILKLLLQEDDSPSALVVMKHTNSAWLLHFFNESLPTCTIETSLRIAAALFRRPRSGQSFAAKFTRSNGWTVLNRVLPIFCGSPDVYCSLLCIALGRMPISQPISLLPPDLQRLELPELFTLFPRAELKLHVPEAMQVVFSVVNRAFDLWEHLRTQGTTTVTTAPPSSTSPPIPGRSQTPEDEGSVGQGIRTSFSPVCAVPTPTLSPVVPQSVSPVGRMRSHTSLGPHMPRPFTDPRASQWLDVDQGSRQHPRVLDQATALASTLQTLMKFAKHLHDNCADFAAVCAKPETLELLVSCLFCKGAIRASPVQKPNSLEQQLWASVDLVYQLLVQVVDSSFKRIIAEGGSFRTGTLAVLDAATKDSVPDGVGETDAAQFQSRVVLDLLEQVESTASRREFLEDDRLAHGLERLCSTLADRLFSGTLGAAADRQVLQFLLHLLERVDADSPQVRSARGDTIKTLYHALNRVVVIMMKTAIMTQSPEQQLMVLRRIINSNKIVLSTSNSEDPFFRTLLYVIYPVMAAEPQDSSSLQGQAREAAFTVWKLIQLTRPEIIDSVLANAAAEGSAPLDLRAGGFELLVQRETDRFSQWLRGNRGVVDAAIEAGLSKVASEWAAVEDKSRDEFARACLLRRTTRRRTRERDEAAATERYRATFGHLQRESESARDIVATLSQRRRADTRERQRLVAVRWAGLTAKLWGERGTWGPEDAPKVAKYRLDFTEGPFRMRNKLQGQCDFFDRFAPIDPETAQNEKIPTSEDAALWLSEFYEEHQRLRARETMLFALIQAAQAQLHVLVRGRSLGYSLSTSPPPGASAPGSGRPLTSSQRTPGSTSPLPPPSLSGHLSESEDDMGPRSAGIPDDYTEDASVMDDQNAAQTTTEVDDKSEVAPPEDELDVLAAKDEKGISRLRRLLEPGDELLHMYICGTVEGMDRRDGLFLICSRNLYVVDGYTLSAGEVIEIDLSKQKSSDGDASSSDKSKVRTAELGTWWGGEIYEAHACRKWSREDVREVQARRYMLRWVGVELFSADGRNHLLVFSKEDIDTVLSKLRSIADATPPYSVTGVIPGTGVSDAAAAAAPQMVTAVVSGADVTLRKLQNVLRSEVNSLGSDLAAVTQQWVEGKITNFAYLMHLNTVAGRTFNDLTQYPVFPWVIADYTSEELDLNSPTSFRDLSKPMGAITKERAEHFRAHFENSRLDETTPPYNYGQHYSSPAIVLYYLIRLEPFARHFLDMQGGRWDHPDRLFHSVQETWIVNTTSTTPQVMELIPEFFYLPEFLCNSCAFNLGAKQNGDRIGDVTLPPWAKGSAREFVRKNLEALESPYVSEHLCEWIDLIFGYKQRGKMAEQAVNVFFHLSYEGAVDVDAIEDPVQRASTMEAIKHFGQTPRQLWDRSPHPRRVVVVAPPPAVFASPASASRLIPVAVKDIGEPVGHLRLSGQNILAVGQRRLVVPAAYIGSPRVIAWGFADGTVRAWPLDKAAQVSVFDPRHVGGVTAAAATEDGRILATAGADAVVRVFYGNKSLSSSKPPFLKAAELCGHYCAVTCIVVSRSHSVIVSGAEDGRCIVWDLNRLAYVRTFRVAQSSGSEVPLPVVALDVHDTTGEIAACTVKVAGVWSVNGSLLSSAALGPGEAFACCAFSREWVSGAGKCLLTGHRDGSIRVWEFDGSLVLRHVLPVPMGTTSISCLYVSPTERGKLVAGTTAGQVLQWFDGETAPRTVSRISLGGTGSSRSLPRPL
eukprot:m51a1_g2237 putative wd repeat and fyve domain-containing protein 3 (4017) ;mRNA; f:264190-277056